MDESPSLRSVRSLRRKVAREAAILLYTSQEKEYKQAKERATENLRTWIMPTNMEVAGELDMIADEREGALRSELLIRKRREALEIIETLKLFRPRLVGSVWRGTAHRNSDIDVTVFCSDPNQILNDLQKKGYEIEKTETVSVVKHGEEKSSFTITINLPSGDEAEVVVKDPENATRTERCEIYGDAAKGLNLKQLMKVLSENPLQRFVPKTKT